MLLLVKYGYSSSHLVQSLDKFFTFLAGIPTSSLTFLHPRATVIVILVILVVVVLLLLFAGWVPFQLKFYTATCFTSGEFSKHVKQLCFLQKF